MSEEIKKNAEELTDEAVEKAAGGVELEIITFVRCPVCQQSYSFSDSSSGAQNPPPCPKCGYNWGTAPRSLL